MKNGAGSEFCDDEMQSRRKFAYSGGACICVWEVLNVLSYTVELWLKLVVELWPRV